MGHGIKGDIFMRLEAERCPMTGDIYRCGLPEYPNFIVSITDGYIEIQEANLTPDYLHSNVYGFELLIEVREEIL